MSEVESDDGSWWGETRLAVDETAQWRIGPLQLTVRRGRREWQVAHEWSSQRSETRDRQQLDEALPEEPAHQERFVVGETGDRIALLPVLADRPVVSLPRVPLHLLPQREITLYVGSPVWVAVNVGDPRSTLCELPGLHLSDTWFGDSTRDGELCYASPTRARLDPDNLPVLSRSAVTPVLIRNLVDRPLFLERLKLPVPLLSLFRGSHGRFWTEGVALTRADDSDMASLDIQAGAPSEAGGSERLSGPRSVAETKPFIRAFSRLFGFEAMEASR